jgi:hypothetical protein
MNTRYVKAEGERKRYQLDYTNWLDTGELVTSVVFTISNQTGTKPLVIDGIQVLPSGLGAQYYVSGGLNTTQYQVTATLTTTTGPQVREDTLIFTIRGT